MTSPSSERLEKLLAMHAKDPRDTLLLYGLAMEYKKLQQPLVALGYLAKVIEIDPGYCYAYFQEGEIQENLGDTTKAKLAYETGIQQARRVGDAHAESELRGALGMLE